MRKNFSRRTRNGGEEQNGVDLRAKLSRIVHAPRIETRQRVFEHKASTLSRRIPPTRSADDLLHMDSSRKSYSAWPLDGVRHRSPDSLLGVSRGMSPPRDADELRRLPSIRPNAPRSNAYMTKGSMEVTRPTTFTTKGSVALEAAKTVSRLPPPVMMHKNPYSVRVEEPLTVASLLHSLGLEKYSIHFQAEEMNKLLCEALVTFLQLEISPSSSSKLYPRHEFCCPIPLLFAHYDYSQGQRQGGNFFMKGGPSMNVVSQAFPCPLV
ncbi:hypothetical protein ACLOJK_004164 [Asimina triloba]